MELAEQRINVNCIAPGYLKLHSRRRPRVPTSRPRLIKNTPWGPHRRPTTTGDVLAVNAGAFAECMYLPLSIPKAR